MMVEPPWDAERLAGELRRASDAYYNSDTPLMTDAEFDSKLALLKETAPSHPFLEAVGAPPPPSVAATKVRLPHWMGSLDKIRDDAAALAAWLRKHPGSCVVSDKLDGNSALLVWQPAGGVRMYTRGDGVTGQDISHLVPLIGGIPVEGLGDAGAGLAVRGELIIPRRSWAEIAHMGANPRNMVAGALHRKTPDRRVASRIRFVAHDLIAMPGNGRVPRPSEALRHMDALGFVVVRHEVVEHDRVTVEQLTACLLKRALESDFECDGIVVAHDAPHRPAAGRNPTHAFAFKSMRTHETAEVTVSSVSWSVSKDGYIKPTVHFTPVVLDGASIQRASGFNAAFVSRHAIGPGARLVVIRSGHVIPHIVKVLGPADSGHAQMPEAPFAWTESGVDAVSIGDAGGEARRQQQVRALEHFVRTLSVQHVGSKTLSRLVEAGHGSIPALMRLTEADVLAIGGFQTTGATRVVGALRGARESASCAHMMAACGAFGRGMGVKRLDAITSAMPAVFATMSVPDAVDVARVEGVGVAAAEAFVRALPEFYGLMREIGVPCRVTGVNAGANDGGRAAGMVVVFSGFRDRQLEAAVRSAGGETSGSVSGRTTHVVTADKNSTSAKVLAARRLGARVCTAEELVGFL